MGVVRQKYYPFGSGAGLVFTAQNIADRASDTGTVTVSGDDATWTDINLSKIRDVLGDTGDAPLGELHRSSAVNCYSWFGPCIISIINKELQYNHPVTVPAPTKDFAGYNHLAVTPGVVGTNVADGGSYETDKVCTGSSAVFGVNYKIHLGELNWYELNSNLYSVQVLLTDSLGNILYSGSTVTIDDTNFDNVTNNDITMQGSISTSSTTGKVQTYYLKMKMYDSSGSELIYFDQDYHFNVTYVVGDYGVDPIELCTSDTNDNNNTASYIDELVYSSSTLSVTTTTATLTVEDFYIKYNGNCESDPIQIYVAYPDSTEWESYSFGDTFDCPPTTGDMVLNLDHSRVNCDTNLRVKIWHDINLPAQRPATRPF